MTEMRETILNALHWYVHDREESAKTQHEYNHEDTAEEHEQEAERAERIIESLEKEDGGIQITTNKPDYMVSPDGSYEERVVVSHHEDHVTVESRTGKQIVIDLGNDGQLRADFSAPSGPAYGDAETHVELTNDDISITDNY